MQGGELTSRQQDLVDASQEFAPPRLDRPFDEPVRVVSQRDPKFALSLSARGQLFEGLMTPKAPS